MIAMTQVHRTLTFAIDRSYRVSEMAPPRTYTRQRGTFTCISPVFLSISRTVKGDKKIDTARNKVILRGIRLREEKKYTCCMLKPPLLDVIASGERLYVVLPKMSIVIILGMTP